MPIPPAEAIEVIRRETEAFDAAVRAADPTARVPSCPDWTVQDLADHVREVHTFFATQLRAADPAARRPHDYDGPTLLETLAVTEPGAPCWNWSGRNLQARWVMRRMAQETSVHRWDAERAGGTEPSPIDLEVAIDGIDELFDMFLVALQDEGADTDIGGSWHLHATDSPHGEWILRSVGGELLVGHGHEKGDAATRGTASDLLLFLWGRVPLDQLEVFGDTSIIDRFKALPIFD